MRIGVVSDSHGHVELTRPAVRMLESLEVSAVLHCGDIGSVEVVRLFERWPTHFVFGNCDYNQTELAQEIAQQSQHTCHGLFGDLEWEGVRIALLHSHERRRFVDTVNDPTYQVVCYGHTHVAAADHQDDKLVLNPGALYRANPHSLAVLDLPSCEATIIHL